MRNSREMLSPAELRLFHQPGPPYRTPQSNFPKRGKPAHPTASSSKPPSRSTPNSNRKATGSETLRAASEHAIETVDRREHKYCTVPQHKRAAFLLFVHYNSLPDYQSPFDNCSTTLQPRTLQHNAEYPSADTLPAMAEHKYKFNVTMTCGGCSGAVERVLKKLDGRPSLYIDSSLRT